MPHVPNAYDEILAVAKALHRAEARCLSALARRSSLPPGSSRARVTTANARWSTAAEARDRALAEFRAAVERAGLA